MPKMNVFADPNSRSGARDFSLKNKENDFVTLAVVFFALWILALGLGFYIRGFIHILLLSSAVMGLIAFIQSRRTP